MPHEQTIDGPQPEHWPGCYMHPAHHECALLEIERLKEEANAYANYIMDSEIISAMMEPEDAPKPKSPPPPKDNTPFRKPIPPRPKPNMVDELPGYTDDFPGWNTAKRLWKSLLGKHDDPDYHRP